MTVVVEGHMRIQFFKADATGKLTRSGTPVDLTAGQTCLIEALRIHDAKYITACKLVYVHNSAYGCYNWASKRGDPRLGTFKRPNEAVEFGQQLVLNQRRRDRCWSKGRGREHCSRAYEAT